MKWHRVKGIDFDKPVSTKQINDVVAVMDKYEAPTYPNLMC